MTIRYTCPGCGSLLKIKDELAGTDGKCPKCKSEFVVPDPEPDVEAAEHETSRDVAPVEAPVLAAEPVTKAAPKPAEKVASKSKKRVDADFDPAEFLMSDDEGSPAGDAIPEMPRSTPATWDSRQSDEDRPSRPTKAPTSSGAGLETGPGFSASAHAREMMKKAMDDTRLHAGDAPEKEERPRFDWAGFFHEVGLKGVGGLLFGIVLTYGLYQFFDSMMGGRLKLPNLGYVTGTVKLDDKPLEGATVYFAPTDAVIPGSKSERPRTSYGITDAAGHFSLVYIGTTTGVAVGKCRVWVDCVGPRGQVVPAELSQANLTIRDVKPGRQEFSFDMKSTP